MPNLSQLVAETERHLLPALLSQIQATRAAIGLPEKMSVNIPAIDTERFVASYNKELGDITHESPESKVAFIQIWIASTEDFYNAISNKYFIDKSLAGVISVIKRYFELSRRELTKKGIGQYCEKSYIALTDAEKVFLQILRGSAVVAP